MTYLVKLAAMGVIGLLIGFAFGAFERNLHQRYSAQVSSVYVRGEGFTCVRRGSELSVSTQGLRRVTVDGRRVF